MLRKWQELVNYAYVFSSFSTCAVVTAYVYKKILEWLFNKFYQNVWKTSNELLPKYVKDFKGKDILLTLVGKGCKMVASFFFLSKNNFKFGVEHEVVYYFPSVYFFNQFFGCPWPTLGHYGEDNLTHLMLITALFNFDPRVTGSLVTRLGP